MKHETRSAYIKKLREQYGETIEQAEVRKRNTNMKILSHKYGNNVNNKTEEKNR